MLLHDRLTEGLNQIGLPVTARQSEQLETYLGLIQKWNQTYNLVADCRTEPLLIRHLCDCLSALPLVAIPPGAHVLDVGSGAGLPGIPWAIFHPDSSFTLLDCNGKKTRFLFQVKVALNMENVRIEQCRLEHYQPVAPVDIVTWRAFASLRDLTEKLGVLMQDHTRLYALKGQLPIAEVADLPPAFEALKLQKITVPFLKEQRHLVTVVKRQAVTEGIIKI
ncbi:MAG: 16S rRNA (guanine(527)-N(7))-methyltransferase RsmG [Pseudomonadota bacterium]|nr:16S rRNA (guanine(527)-N(7))-methyltransferase RsmG [Pseudomonadota bacterium]